MSDLFNDEVLLSLENKYADECDEWLFLCLQVGILPADGTTELITVRDQNTQPRGKIYLDLGYLSFT